jgi:cytochrome c peroxidase
MATMVSANSKYDKYVRHEEGVVLTNDEMQGLTVFTQKCASCHATDLFTDQSYRNTGLYYNATLEDTGRERVTHDANDYMKFRVPSLRNIELTAPYMHDGRFYTLNAVLNHYNSGVIDYPNLDPLLKQNGYTGIPLSTDEKQFLIAFLKTLTDYEFINNSNYSEN